MWTQYLIFILLGAVSMRGALGMMVLANKGSLNIPLFWSSESGVTLLIVYSILAVILGAVNGFLLNGWQGLLIVALGVWPFGMFVLEMLLPRKYYLTKFLLFGMINVVLTVLNIFSF